MGVVTRKMERNRAGEKRTWRRGEKREEKVEFMWPARLSTCTVLGRANIWF